MKVFSVYGSALPEDFFLPDDGLVWQTPAWRSRLQRDVAQRRLAETRRLLAKAFRELEDRSQPRATARHLLHPLADLLGWPLDDRPERVETDEGEEEAGYAIGSNDAGPFLFARALAPDASFDAPPDGHHRRFAPTLVMERVLRQRGMDFGILLNGTTLRLLHHESGLSSWLDLNLVTIAEGTEDGERVWAFLWGFLRYEALRAGHLSEALREARQHGLKVGEDLGEQVREALRQFLNALLQHPENASLRESIEIHRLHEEALHFLYRLLFILYAEARGLLPLENPVYYEGYSLARWSEWAFRERPRLTDHDAFLETTLRTLFRLLWEGADLGPMGRIPAYRGRLFDPESTPILNRLRVGGRTLAEVLIRLAYRQTPQGWRRVSYRTLAVEHIGTVYEILLEYVPAIASETLWEVQIDGRREVLTRAQLIEVMRRRPCRNPEAIASDPELTQAASVAPSAGPNPFSVEGQLEPGMAYLRAGFRRKQTGTYFTHPALVDFLVRQALEPLTRGKSAEELLQLKVVDPAMGSGHFLVAACRFLAEKLLAAYKREFDRVLRESPDWPESEVLPAAGIPRPVAAVWHDEERALAACKLLVAAYCLYGVDKNPLAVDLARVTLWIETAARDQPLTFLDHRLRVGDSLLGFVNPLHLLRLPAGAALPAGHPWLGQEELRARIERILKALQDIERMAVERPEDLQGLRNLHEQVLEGLRPFRELHDVRIGARLIADDESASEATTAWLQDLQVGHTVTEDTRRRAEPFWRKGQEARAFCWPLEFPDVFFNPDGTLKAHPGFDAVLGNPPWDKVKPQELEFYAEYDPLIGDYQGQRRKDRIRELHRLFPGLEDRWNDHKQAVQAYVAFLTRSGIYRHSFATLCGACGALLPEVHCPRCDDLTPLASKCAFCDTALFGRHQPMRCPACSADLRGRDALRKTGGDPDLSRFFAERAWQLTRDGGWVGFLLPAGFYATEGATALRRLLLDKSQLRACFSLENRKRIMPIHRSFKFAAVVFRKGGQTDEFPAAFMLHDPEFLDLPDTHPDRLRREVRLTRSFIDRTSPGYRMFLEVKNEMERRLTDRLHRQFPRLGETVTGAWQASFSAELHMTQDSYLFRTAEQLEEHLAVRQEPDAASRRGGILYRTPNAETYRQKGYRVLTVPQLGVEVALPDDALPGRTAEEMERELREEMGANNRSRRPARRRSSTGLLREVLTRGFVCDDSYVPLYEGRMVHQFDPAAKAYVSGEGRRQVWEYLDWYEKHLHPHYFVSARLFAAMLPRQQRFRAGFLGVNSATNERTLQSAIVPAVTACGNAVPTVRLTPDDPCIALVWTATANSFIGDWLIRVLVKENLNFVFISQLPMPRLSPDDGVGREMVVLSARLNCVLPELAELWEQVA